jgi:tRNA pseudouridine55 synthase
VCIEELTLEIESADRLRFQVLCSKGTYVRVLAVDVGRALGTCAHLSELRRTRFGSFRIEDALVDLDGWDASAGIGLLSLTQALAHLPVSRVDEQTCQSVRQGQHWALRDLDLPENTDTAALLDRADEVVAVVVRKGGKWRFGRVFHNGPVSLQQPATLLSTQDK